MKISEIREILNGWGFEHTFTGCQETEIVGFSDPRSYRKGTVIWVGKVADVMLPETLCTEDLALVMAKPGSGVDEAFPNVILLANPKQAFMKLVTQWYGEAPKAYQDATAYVSAGAAIGENCWIGRNVVIEDGAEIGDRCVIRENTYIGKNTVMGNDCTVGQNVVIAGETNGSVFEDTDGILKNMPNVGRVVIGKYVKIGAGSIIANGTFTETVIGDECVLNAGTSIGHNCVIGRRTMLLGRCTLSGNSRIGDGCELISTCVKNRIVIGDRVKVGIGSVVLKDIADGMTCFGNPARTVPMMNR